MKPLKPTNFDREISRQRGFFYFGQLKVLFKVTIIVKRNPYLNPYLNFGISNRIKTVLSHSAIEVSFLCLSLLAL